MRLVLLLCVFVALGDCKGGPRKPNIVFIMADDMGYQDVGFRGSDIRTPNLDRLAAEGVILENHYVMPQCSPTRSSLMSGRYAIRTGFWKGNIKPAEEWGLRLNETTMPEMLQRNGYATHGVGKWHCGMYTWEHTPVKRGFDTFLGGYLGSQGYFTHKNRKHLDLRMDYFNASGSFVDDVRGDLNGVYNTEIFTNHAKKIIETHDSKNPLFLYLSYTAPHTPLEVSHENLTKYTSHMTNMSSNIRKKYAAMVSVMDHGIGEVVDTLEQYNLRDNTILVFSSDNGAVHNAPGSNYPLRGGKNSLFEGGVRSVTFVNSPLLDKTGYTNTNLHHVVDWYKTFQLMVGDELISQHKPQLPLDGVDIWKSISQNKSSGREEVLLNYRTSHMIMDNSEFRYKKMYYQHELTQEYLDKKANEFFVIRWKNWKMFLGTFVTQGWGNKNSITTSSSRLGHSKLETKTWLFDLDVDPREKTNVASQYPDIVTLLSEKAPGYLHNMTRINKRVSSSEGKVNGVWYPWVSLN